MKHNLLIYILPIRMFGEREREPLLVARQPPPRVFPGKSILINWLVEKWQSLGVTVTSWPMANQYPTCTWEETFGVWKHGRICKIMRSKVWCYSMAYLDRSYPRAVCNTTQLTWLCKSKLHQSSLPGLLMWRDAVAEADGITHQHPGASTMDIQSCNRHRDKQANLCQIS